jgi:hypothetical protein
MNEKRGTMAPFSSPRSGISPAVAVASSTTSATTLAPAVATIALAASTAVATPSTTTEATAPVAEAATAAAAVATTAAAVAATAAAVAATAAAVAAATAAETTPAWTAATTTTATWSAFARFIHRQRTPIEHEAVHGLSRFLGLLGSRHLDEAEAARTARGPVKNDTGRDHLAVSAESLAK